MKKYALLSLSDKTNLELLVTGLKENNFNLIGTTSTAKSIKELGFECVLVEEITNFPEMLGGRVKTLQPEIHGGILADLTKIEHIEDLKRNDINPIALVVCNLYPFAQVLDNELTRHEQVLKDNPHDINESLQQLNDNVIENIDIGGVTLLRAAAKNYKNVTLLCDPNDYEEYISKLNENKIDLVYREMLASKGFMQTANYDAMIAKYYMSKSNSYKQLLVSEPLKQQLRYGENPQQSALYFEKEDKTSFSLGTSTIIQGKELSYNNILDIDAAYNAIYEFTQPCAIALKHNTPCGVGYGSDVLTAYEECYKVDPISIFGGIVIFNQEVNLDLAKKLNEIFLEIIIAPSFSKEALLELARKKNLRLIKGNYNRENVDREQLRSINGGYLYQDKMVDEFTCDVVTKNKIADDILENLANLYKIVKNVKSNAIVIGQDNRVMGISGGMVSRVDAVNFAIEKTINKDDYKKDSILFLASDGFFPFNDIVDLALKFNIKYIIQPGGSMNDEKLIDACNDNNINMIFTNTRFFKH